MLYSIGFVFPVHLGARGSQQARHQLAWLLYRPHQLHGCCKCPFQSFLAHDHNHWLFKALCYSFEHHSSSRFWTPIPSLSYSVKYFKHRTHFSSLLGLLLEYQDSNSSITHFFKLELISDLKISSCHATSVLPTRDTQSDLLCDDQKQTAHQGIKQGYIYIWTSLALVSWNLVPFLTQH